MDCVSPVEECITQLSCKKSRWNCSLECLSWRNVWILDTFLSPFRCTQRLHNLQEVDKSHLFTQRERWFSKIIRVHALIQWLSPMQQFSQYISTQGDNGRESTTRMMKLQCMTRGHMPFYGEKDKMSMQCNADHAIVLWGKGRMGEWGSLIRQRSCSQRFEDLVMATLRHAQCDWMLC